MQPSQIPFIALILFAGAAIQGAVGFSYALFATPLLVWLGVPLTHCIVLVGVSSLVQSLTGSRRLRADVPWKEVFRSIVVRWSTLLVGLLVLRRLVGLPLPAIRLFLGIVICLLVGMQMSLSSLKPVPRLHWGWNVLAAGCSGFFAGLVGMGGPPLVLYALAHDWSPARTKGYLFSIFMLTIPVQLVLMFAAFGGGILMAAVLGAVLATLTFTGCIFGMRLSAAMSKPMLRRLAYGLLLLIGVNSIVQPVLFYLQT